MYVRPQKRDCLTALAERHEACIRHQGKAWWRWGTPPGMYAWDENGRLERVHRALLRFAPRPPHGAVNG